MKPKDLKAPFSWEERRPLIQDHIFHLPDRYDDYSSFSFPTWQELFSSDCDVRIEFCSGNGKWIFERAKEAPHINWVAVEWDFDRVRKIWSKIKNHGLKNLMVVSGEASNFSRNYLREECVSQIYINFPDPWPKKKHEKHRLMKPSFLAELNRILKKEGKVIFVTDEKNYLEWTLKHVMECNLFSYTLLSEIENYGTSYFDELWRTQGKEIFYLELLKSV